jgi:L-aminopeptidase/D-esterase-like protein
MAGAIKGGVGSASVRVGDCTVAALVVVNAYGAVVDEAGIPLALAQASAERVHDDVSADRADDAAQLGANTTIGVVATDLPLDKAGASRLALAAHDGLAQAVRPAHTAFDGDTFFALSTAKGQPRVWPVPPAITGAAADVVAVAIRRAVRLARGLGGVPGLGDAPLP